MVHDSLAGGCGHDNKVGRVDPSHTLCIVDADCTRFNHLANSVARRRYVDHVGTESYLYEVANNDTSINLISMLTGLILMFFIVLHVMLTLVTRYATSFRDASELDLSWCVPGIQL